MQSPPILPYFGVHANCSRRGLKSERSGNIAVEAAPPFVVWFAPGPMSEDAYRNHCIYHTLDGLRDGLSLFSQPSRAALIYAVGGEDAIRIYDPQHLLRGHEPILKETYLDNERWRENAPDLQRLRHFGQIDIEPNLKLAGLISCGARSPSLFYQMWFTEHHPDMCATGPTERWLEHAAWLLSHDFASERSFYTGTSGYVLRGYATHAVRDFIIDEINVMMGLDSQIRIYPLLGAVLGISATREEHAPPRGELVFVEPYLLAQIEFVARFPDHEQPSLENYKHVRKLLQTVQDSDRKLISDGRAVIGIAVGELPRYRIVADFRGRHGFLGLDGDWICSFSDGSFHSSTQRAKMVELEEILIESRLRPDRAHKLFKIVSEIVHYAEAEKFGCTLVIDLNQRPMDLAGQHFKRPLSLEEDKLLDLARNLARVDGALHIAADLRLHGFACLLDGRAVVGEDRARGARYNSALRFTAEKPDLIVVVVSADRPVSIIHEGVNINAACAWRPIPGTMTTPPTMKEWLEAGGF